MKKILVIGQTPPPYGGQAMMIKRLVDAKLEMIEIIHVRMSFSDSFKQVGRVSITKFLHIFYIIKTAIVLKFKYQIDTLYYPPAGPNLNPIIRDWIILFFIRPFFRNTIFHFRAAGISEFLQTKPKLIREILKFPYKKPSLAIQLSNLNPADGFFFSASKVEVIPNGLEDAAVDYDIDFCKKSSKPINILNVGVLKRTKGLLVLLEAISLLKDKELDIKLSIVGEFDSDEFEEEVQNYISEKGINEYIYFKGVKTGADKWKEFLNADIMCFPTYFESESFGNVLLEAMMFGLPIVASEWRGIPDIVKNNENGTLVPIKNPKKLSEALELLIKDSHLRIKFGEEGRNRFLGEYSIEQHLSNMEKTIFDVIK